MIFGDDNSLYTHQNAEESCKEKANDSLCTEFCQIMKEYVDVLHRGVLKQVNKSYTVNKRQFLRGPASLISNCKIKADSQMTQHVLEVLDL